jgi:hypothetical protein
MGAGSGGGSGLLESIEGPGRCSRWCYRLSGEAALAAVLERLACFEAPAQAWEADLLPARLSDVDPAWLDRFAVGPEGMATAQTQRARRKRRGHVAKPC